MCVIHGVDRYKFNNFFEKKKGRVAEWSTLQTSKRGDSSSIPTQVKTFYGGIKSLEQYIAPHFELH